MQQNLIIVNHGKWLHNFFSSGVLEINSSWENRVHMTQQVDLRAGPDPLFLSEKYTGFATGCINMF